MKQNEPKAYYSKSVSNAVTSCSSTQLNLFPYSELDDDLSDRFLLIKHDYYASNNESGKILLSSILEYFMNNISRIAGVYFVDSGTRLISDSTDNCYASFINLLKENGVHLAYLTDSFTFYNHDSTNIDGTVGLNSSTFFAEIFNLPSLITIE